MTTHHIFVTRDSLARALLLALSHSLASPRLASPRLARTTSTTTTNQPKALGTIIKFYEFDTAFRPAREPVLARFAGFGHLFDFAVTARYYVLVQVQ